MSRTHYVMLCEIHAMLYCVTNLYCSFFVLFLISTVPCLNFFLSPLFLSLLCLCLCQCLSFLMIFPFFLPLTLQFLHLLLSFMHLFLPPLLLSHTLSPPIPSLPSLSLSHFFLPLLPPPLSLSSPIYHSSMADRLLSGNKCRQIL